MNRIGLALSGGGFRASLYHLGLVRWLRDGGILPRITDFFFPEATPLQGQWRKESTPTRNPDRSR
jgi:hypothetical protein